MYADYCKLFTHFKHFLPHVDEINLRPRYSTDGFTSMQEVRHVLTAWQWKRHWHDPSITDGLHYDYYYYNLFYNYNTYQGASCGMRERITRNLTLRFTDGQQMNEIPHPDADWNEFLRTIRDLCSQQAKVYCPVDGLFRPWVDTKQLQRDFKFADTSNSTFKMLFPRDKCNIS